MEESASGVAVARSYSCAAPTVSQSKHGSSESTLDLVGASMSPRGLTVPLDRVLTPPHEPPLVEDRQQQQKVAVSKFFDEHHHNVERDIIEALSALVSESLAI